MLKETGAAMQDASAFDVQGGGLGFLPLIAGAGATLLSSTALRTIGSRALAWLGMATAAAAGSSAATDAAPATSTQPSTSSNLATMVKWAVAGFAIYVGYRVYKGFAK